MRSFTINQVLARLNEFKEVSFFDEESAEPIVKLKKTLKNNIYKEDISEAFLSNEELIFLLRTLVASKATGNFEGDTFNFSLRL